jgi:hypothetical protein
MSPRGERHARRHLWRIIAKALGEKADAHSKLADQVAIVRLLFLTAYMTTNLFICAGVIRHWND